jgi:thiopeptide-type bacteriocin biosynthesis protein
MDLLLDDLGLDARAKLAVAERSRESFGREFRETGTFTHQLGARFRQARAGLDAAWAPDGGGDELLAQGLAVLRERSARIGLLGRRLEAAWAEGRLTVPVPRLADSYLHMYANRLLRSAARAQEWVLYDFLVRTYRSRLARTRAQEQ